MRSERCQAARESKASGVVQKVTALEGDLVKKGALLVGIDPIVERRNVTQSMAELRGARAQVASAASKRQFAMAHGVTDTALRYWAGRLTQEDARRQRVSRPIGKAEPPG